MCSCVSLLPQSGLIKKFGRLKIGVVLSWATGMDMGQVALAMKVKRAMHYLTCFKKHTAAEKNGSTAQCHCSRENLVRKLETLNEGECTFVRTRRLGSK